MPANQYTSLTAYICVSNAVNAIDLYARAFGAVERYRIPNESGGLGHAELAIGDSILMLSDEWPEGGVFAPGHEGVAATAFVLEVDDPDAAYQRAVAAGCTGDRPVADAPYGRGGWVRDPFGYRWNVQKPNPDFDPSEMQ